MIPWKLLPYLAGLILLIGAYGYGHHNGKASSEAAWQARWQARDAADTKARDAELARQKAQQDATEARNAEILEKLNDKSKEAAAARADADLARRLLARATRPSAGGDLPKAEGGPPAPAAGGAAGNEGLAGLLGDALGECRRNADRLDALIEEITPQL